MMTTQTPVSITVTLTPDHVQALAAMVELGTDDRREYLARYAEENDYTPEDIARGHYEADCADEAVAALADALAALQNESESAHNLEPKVVEAAPYPSNGWVIYSANEAASNHGRGFWHRVHGWAEEDAASEFAAEHVGCYSRLPKSTGDDAAWVHYPLMTATTEAELVYLWKQFCEATNLPCLSADELLADEELALAKDQCRVFEHRWITQFRKQWEAIVG